MPNPADNLEILNNYNKNCPFSFFRNESWCYRATKIRQGDDRENFINKLINLNRNIKLMFME